MATMNISLPEQMKSFAGPQTRDGRYANVSDYLRFAFNLNQIGSKPRQARRWVCCVLRDLIRRDQDRRQAIAEIQALVDEGLASGPAVPFDPKAFFAGLKAKYLHSNPDAEI